MPQPLNFEEIKKQMEYGSSGIGWNLKAINVSFENKKITQNERDKLIVLLYSKGKSDFKSKIDWGKWNEEIPKHKELIREYLVIEITTKSNGTWMKNLNGSQFSGTPEQFVQQNSSWFKKAFPNPIKNEFGQVQINYHGSPIKLEGNLFDPEKSGKNPMFGGGIYTTANKETAIFFMNELDSKDKHLYELYINSNNPQNNLSEYYKLKCVVDEAIKKYRFGSIEHSKAQQNAVYEWNLQAKDNRYLKEGYDFVYLLNDNEHQLIPFSNYPKSAIGNVGFFDMTNPDIYK